MTQGYEATCAADLRYTYDWRGRRLEREDETASANGPKRRYYFWGLTPIAERVGTYGLGYSWDDDVYNTLSGGDLGQVLFRRTGGSTDTSLHYDHIGNVVAEADTSGVIVSEHMQDAYGRPVLDSYAGGWDNNSLHQTTKPWDADAGLFYFNARWYEAGVGRFASPAPMGRDSEQPYSAAGQNPVSGADPSGRIVLPVIPIIVIIGGCFFSSGCSSGGGSGPPPPKATPTPTPTPTPPPTPPPPAFIPGTKTGMPGTCAGAFWDAFNSGDHPCRDGAMALATCLSNQGFIPGGEVVSVASEIESQCSAGYLPYPPPAATPTPTP